VNQRIDQHIEQQEAKLTISMIGPPGGNILSICVITQQYFMTAFEMCATDEVAISHCDRGSHPNYKARSSCAHEIKNTHVAKKLSCLLLHVYKPCT
jgi:hypothetical protein